EDSSRIRLHAGSRLSERRPQRALRFAGQPDPQRRRRERRPAGTHPRRADAGGERHRLSVRDEGAGIRPQDLDRIFEPGFTTKPFGEGSGMGLVVVQSVVRNMFAGSVAVDSTVGTGTTVTVTLPIPAQRGVDSRSEAPPLVS